MHNNHFTGIFGHFFLRAIIIQAFVGVLILTVMLPYYDYAARQLAAEQGRTVASTTLSATTDTLYDQNYPAIVEFCLNVIKATPNVLFIAFSSREGDELIVSDNKWVMQHKSLPYYDLNFQASAQQASKSAYVMDYDGLGLGFSEYYNFSEPVYISGKEWGVLTISFSNSAYLTSIRTFNKLVFVFTLISSLLAFTLFFYSSRRIRKQINALADVAKNLAKGNLSTKAEESAIGEIGVLGQGINNMSATLREKSQRVDQLVKVVEQTQDAMILLNASGHVIFANAAFETVSGYSMADVIDIPQAALFSLLQLPDDLLNDDQPLPIIASKLPHDLTLAKKDQAIVDVAIQIESIDADADADASLTLLVISDISERKLAEVELRIAATAFESQEGMIVTDAHNVILRVNHAFTEITGYEASEVVGRTPHLLSSGRHNAAFYEAMWQSICNTGAWEGEIWNSRKNNDIYPQHLTITAVKNIEGIITNYVATLTDITARKEAEDKIQHLAFYDSLTGLPNRRLFVDRLSQAMATASRSSAMGGLLFLDLDHFKTLNDTLGHDVGDLLLQQVAIRLNKMVREGDTVARLGGDEFVVLLEDLSSNNLEAAAQTEIIAEKILTTLNMVYQLGPHEYYSSPSIGATLFAGNMDDTAEDILKQADIAMYQAKGTGRNAMCFFDPEMQASIHARAELEKELRIAIIKQEFRLYFQVQVDENAKPLGAEALIRWAHPKHGLVAPGQFITLAEETNLILPIGQWVLDAACAQLSLWQHSPQTHELTISVNVSARQFRQEDFAAQVIATVHRHAINPKYLKLELTESLLLDHVDDIIVTMNDLKTVGIMFSLDDFGTGYSSLQYLKKLPLYQLKVDQSFVRDLAVDENDVSIVRTIVAMAKSLDLQVIAEGVETEQQHQQLLQLGCTHFQGYLFSKPLPIDAFEALLALEVSAE